MRDYGVDNFSVSLIEETTNDLVNTREIYYIDKLKPALNMTAGGDGGSTTHNYMWIHNGTENNYVLKSSSIPDGWVRGRLCKFNDPDFQREMSKRSDVKKRAETQRLNWAAGKYAHIDFSNRGMKGDANPTKRPEVRAKLSRAGLNRPYITCPHCNKTGKQSPGMYKHHFDKCKYKNDKD